MRIETLLRRAARLLRNLRKGGHRDWMAQVPPHILAPSREVTTIEWNLTVVAQTFADPPRALLGSDAGGHHRWGCALIEWGVPDECAPTHFVVELVSAEDALRLGDVASAGFASVVRSPFRLEGVCS